MPPLVDNESMIGGINVSGQKGMKQKLLAMFLI